MKFNLSFLCLLFPCFIFSQEQLGLRLENYAGANSISLNPTGNLTNPLSWDLNLVGAGIFFENNYAFIKNTNTIDLLRNANDAEFISADKTDDSFRQNIYIVDYKNDNRKRFFSFNSFIAGPSLVFKIKENHSVGIFTNMRAALSTLNVPNEFSYYKYDNWPLNEPFSVQPFDGTFMSWSEIGLNYAVKIPNSLGYMGLGINVKRLTGYEAGYLENLQPWTHTKLINDTIIVGNSQGHYGLTNSNLNGNDNGITSTGKGFGFDLGFVQVIQEYEDGYKWRIGASILDIGSINFNKNAQTHTVTNSGEFKLALDEFNFNYSEETDEFLQYFSEQALGDSLASQTSNSFKLALPTAVSLQADYSFNKHVYLNGSFIHRLPTGKLNPRRSSLLAVTPRFEHRWFSASMPVSFLNWQKMQVGLAARLGFLVIGSDKIGSLIAKSDYYGTDFYVALKVNPFNLGLFDGGNGGKRKFGKGKDVKCYDF